MRGGVAAALEWVDVSGIGEAGAVRCEKCEWKGRCEQEGGLIREAPTRVECGQVNRTGLQVPAWAMGMRSFHPSQAPVTSEWDACC